MMETPRVFRSLEEPHTDVPTAKPAVVSKETPAIPNIWPFKFAFGKRSYSANFADDRLQLAEYRPSGQGNYGTLVAYGKLISILLHSRHDR